MNSTIFRGTISFMSMGIALLFASIVLEFVAGENLSTEFAELTNVINSTMRSLGMIMSGISVFILGVLVFYQSNETKVDRKKQQAATQLRNVYNNGLYGTLEQFLKLPAANEDSEILNDFYKIANMILATGKGENAYETVLFFDSEATNETLALQEIFKTLNKNIPITDTTVLTTMQQVTARLQKHYDLYYQQNLEGVKEELYILKKLDK